VIDGHGNIYIAATFAFGRRRRPSYGCSPTALDLPFGGSGYAYTGISSSGASIAMWKAKPTVVGDANFSTDLDDLVARIQV
jgi:hypothetical protein